MTKLFIVFFAAGLSAVALSSSASAVSCSDRANFCMKNGGQRPVCFGPALAACKTSGIYVGPYSGKPFPTNERKRS